VQVRVVMRSNQSNEYLCIDNVCIFADTPTKASRMMGGEPTAALACTEGAPATAVAPAITVTDADSASLTSATVTISQNLVSTEDMLSATPSGAILAGDMDYNSATDGTGINNQPIREVAVSDAVMLQTLPFVESFKSDGRGSRYALAGRGSGSAAPARSPAASSKSSFSSRRWRIRRTRSPLSRARSAS
jgi:hypothetical protein